MRRRRQRPVTLVACLALVSILSGSPIASAQPAPPGQPISSGPSRPNVLIITVDTLRPDALRWVDGTGETPTMDGLAQAGLAFPTAVSPVPITLPAHSSLFTGLLPRRHGVRDNGQLLAATVPTLAERLQQSGYATAAFVSGFPLQRMFGLDRGFDHYDDHLPDGNEGWLERRAVDTSAAARAWLDDAPEPWFAWVHYYDPHDPYEPPREFWQPGARGPYDGEVAYTDHAIGQLLDGLASPTKSLLTVLTADHGEALGEHQENTHGYFIYDSTVTIPMIVHWPGTIPATRSDHPARLVDVAPTVLDWLGLASLAGIDGQSLRPLAEGQTLPPAPAYIETRLPWVYFGWSPLKALRDQDWKLVVAPRPELFDLATDPGEQNNVIDTERRQARRLQGLMKEVEARPMVGATAASADPESLAKLRALGYVGAGDTGGAEPPAGLPDPKDRVAMRQTLLDAEGLMKDGRFAAAVARFDAVLAEEPDNRFATLRAGTALLKAGQPAAAVARLERAVALDPARAEARYVLGEALLRLGRFAEATPQWMELARLQPRRFEAWANLAAALHGDGQHQRAVEAVDRAIALAPDEAPLRQAHARYAAAAKAASKE